MIIRIADYNDIEPIESLLQTRLSSTCKDVAENIKRYIVAEENSRIVGVCGISGYKDTNEYGLDNLGTHRQILYLVVDEDYEKQGIATKLLGCLSKGNFKPILYEAWGDGSLVNPYYVLERNNFKLLKDLGDTYYSDRGDCSTCVNKNKGCKTCKAELWIKE